MSTCKVSFCIPAYKQKGNVSNLVRHILKSDRNDIEVIVLDNHSEDGTIEELNTINDLRLSVYEHTETTDALINWLDALNYGKGEWLFHIIGRDWINIDYIDILVETLDKIKQQNVAFAVAGEDIRDDIEYTVLKKGLETINEFGLRDQHPTGQIFRKDIWDVLTNKDQFFLDRKKYGIYPHGYLYALMGNIFSGAFLHFDITDMAHYEDRYKMCSPSNMYKGEAEKEGLFFMPDSRFHRLLENVENLILVDNREYYGVIVVNRYMRYFTSATYIYMNYCNDDNVKRRYNCQDLSTDYLEILQNGYEFSLKFRDYLEMNRFDWADKNFYELFNKVDSQLITGLINWTNNYI